MPQIDNYVDNICNSYNESSNNMYEKFFKKRLITVPVSHFHQTIIITPTTEYDESGCLYYYWRRINCLSWNMKTNKKMGQKRFVRTFLSVPFTFMHHFAFSPSLFTRSSVGRKIHTYDIYKTKVQ